MRRPRLVKSWSLPVATLQYVVINCSRECDRRALLFVPRLVVVASRQFIAKSRKTTGRHKYIEARIPAVAKTRPQHAKLPLASPIEVKQRDHAAASCSSFVQSARHKTRNQSSCFTLEPKARLSLAAALSILGWPGTAVLFSWFTKPGIP